MVVTKFAAPHSYTGDDVVEIAAHGSPVLLERVVALALSQGARLAQPGEFTFRAYLNGRMDLIQAEAVADLVNAVTPLQARVAMDQLEGTLTADLASIDAAVFDLSARLEASLDFPEEGFHFVTKEQAADELRRIRQRAVRLISSARAGRVVREGRTVVIAGRPNAGKSSLFNALVGTARAIVTEIPGTTRDLLTERVDINGLDITLVDTAGIREATDAIEAEGVERALQAQRIAALTLIVVDGSADNGTAVSLNDGPSIVVLAKCDLPRRSALVAASQHCPVVEVSALTGEGLDGLRATVARTLTGLDDFRDTPRMSNVRHVTLIEDVVRRIDRAADALREGATEELVLADLHAARAAIEELTGRRTADDLLEHIFSNFCVGK